MKAKNKKSQAHVEIIISFVIFVGFVLAMLLFLNPASNKKTDYSSLDKVWEKIYRNISSNVYHASLVADIPSNVSCFKVDNLYNISYRFVVLDEEGKKLEANFENNKENIVIKKQASGKAYDIYFSSSFSAQDYNPNNCLNLQSQNYDYGSINVERRILTESIESLENNYLNDYAGLKIKLGIKEDFDFYVINITGGILFNKTLELAGLRKPDVLARQIPLRVINKNLTNIDIIMQLRVW
jgi:hypothetical protein